MMKNERGFTLIEVMIAVIVLSVGVVAIAASFGTSVRFNGQAWRFTRATAIAGQRFETLRRQANATIPRCTALSSGTATVSGNITETWTVSTVGSGRVVTVIVQMPRPNGVTVDTVRTYLECV